MILFLITHDISYNLFALNFLMFKEFLDLNNISKSEKIVKQVSWMIVSDNLFFKTIY